MQKTRRITTDRSLKIISMLISVALLIVAAPRSYASNFLLNGRYDQVSSSVAGSVATHTFGFSMGVLGTPIGSIRFEFCANSPIIGEACTIPVGLDISGTTLASQQGETGFSISGASNVNNLILTRPAALPTGNPSLYSFTNIINPTTDGSYYVRIETFTSTDATGADVEQGGVVFAIVPALTVTSIVPPYIRFCASVTIAGYDCSTATSYFIDMGEFSTSNTTRVSSEFVVATNAGYGYSVTMSGTTLTSGNNTIPAIFPGGGSTIGTNQFGVNLRANSTPSIGADPNGLGVGVVALEYNTPNLFRFRSGDTLVTSNNSSDNQKFTVSYVTNINGAQPAGYYATTITYICLANF